MRACVHILNSYMRSFVLTGAHAHSHILIGKGTNILRLYVNRHVCMFKVHALFAFLVTSFPLSFFVRSLPRIY